MYSTILTFLTFYGWGKVWTTGDTKVHFYILAQRMQGGSSNLGIEGEAAVGTAVANV